MTPLCTDCCTTPSQTRPFFIAIASQQNSLRGGVIEASWTKMQHAGPKL